MGVDNFRVVMQYGGNFLAVGGFSFFGGNHFGGSGKPKYGGIFAAVMKYAGNFLAVRPVTMETLCFHKKKVRISKIRQKISVPLAMSTNLRKKSFKLFKNPEKKNSWADLGPRSA